MENRAIEEEKKISVYVTIANNIRKKILNRTYRPGDLLPSENELSVYFSASRVTIRKSLSLLVIEGFITSEQGRGYVVNRPRNDIYGLEFSLAKKPELKIKFNKVLIEMPNEQTRELLDIDEDKMVVYIRKLIYRGNVIVGCDIKYLPYDMGMPILEEEIKYADFPEMVAKKISPFELRTKMRICLERPGAELAALMDTAENELMLVMHKTIEISSGEKIGYGITYLRESYGDIYAYSGYGPKSNISNISL